MSCSSSDGYNLVGVCCAGIEFIDRRQIQQPCIISYMRIFCFLHPLPFQHCVFIPHLLRQLSFRVAPRCYDSPLAYTRAISSLPATAVTFRTSRELHLRGRVSTASTCRLHPPLTHLQKGSDGKHEVGWENQSFLKAQIILPTLEKSLFWDFFFCKLMLIYL